MNSWLGPGILLFAGYSLLRSLLEDRQFQKELEVDHFFPTLDLTGWGVGRAWQIPSEFPPEFRISDHSFSPFLREGRIEGWWVEGPDSQKNFFEDRLLTDQKGEAHVKILKG